MRRCGSCSEENPEGARFCAFCGSPLSSGAVEERKRVSVVFVDMVGSTEYAGGADVEDVRDTLAEFQSLVGERLAGFGASVEKFIGDAAVAVFGAPVAHEDDPERAVRAAIAIRDAVIARNERAAGAAFHVRLGVHTGEALVALSSHPASGEPIATGDVMNTAARLQAGAPVDGILVGEPTHRATRDAIEYGDAPAVEAKGKSDPLPAWVALRPRARTGVDLGRHVPTALVDRREEWAALLAAFEAASGGGAAQTVLLVGAPGIGKSRLAWELASHLESAPDIVRWRQGRTPAYGEGVTFVALAEMVKAEAGILETDDSGTAARKLSASVHALVGPGESEWVERHLRGLVGLEGGSDLRGDRRAEAFAAWRHFLDCLAQRYPLVLAFEDMHWADDALLDFIEHLRTWATTRLLILVTARPELLERRPGWTSAPSSTVIRVGPLTDGDATDLLAAAGEDRVLGTAQRDQLLAQAGGNPLYALEFLRLLVDQGLLAAEGRETSGSLPVPDSVLAIIAARIDALPAGDKAVLQDAAVVGRVFWPGAVAAVTGRGVWAVNEVLRRLEERELVRRRQDSSVHGEIEFAFVHALVRDVAYRTTVRSARAGKHRSAAEWIETLGSDRRDRAGTLAHHYDLALRAAPDADPELRARTAAAFHEAADHALGLHAHAQAVDLSARAIELAGSDDPRRPRLLLTHATALALADRPALDALANAAGALADAGDDDGAAEAESTAAWLTALAGDMAAARLHDERALDRVADRPPSRAKALVLCRAGTHRIFQPEHHLQGAALLDSALGLARALGMHDIEAEALQFAGMGRISAGDLRGREDVEGALALALEQSSEVSLSCYGNLADIHKRLGDLDRAAELTADGLRAATRFGVAVQVRRFRAEDAVHRFWRGEWDDALRIAEEYLAAVDAGRHHQMEAEMRVLRGRILLSRGELDEARGEARRATVFARKTGHPYDVLPALAFGSRVAAALHDPEAGAAVDMLLAELASHQLLWAALALPDAVAAAGMLGREADLCAILAGAPAATPWTRAALAHADGRSEDAAAAYAAIGARPEEASARTAAGRLLASHGRGDEAAAHLDAANAFWRSVGAAFELQQPAAV
ncbi:MAG TPA: AAA family ATPase [Gaiellales bacterium]